VLASGSGSNFEAVVSASRTRGLPVEVTRLIVNRAECGALARAARLGIPAEAIVWDRRGEPRAAYDARVLAAVAASRPDVVLLLGWMHVLSPDFVRRFPDVLNIHPAFLPLDPAADWVELPDGSRSPAFRGAHPVDDALAAGASWIGASVHRAGEAVDRGEILARRPLKLEPGEDRAALEARLHALEHEVLDEAIRHWALSEA
jgi:folate-dependent phosphoribosylglycinamide formyltransferase PurN